MSTEHEKGESYRATHHGPVTRLTGQLEDVLKSGDARRMKQLRQSLTNKLHVHVLSKLHDKLIDLAPNEQLEEEVQQADLVKEWINLAIISLEDKLESLSL